MALCDAGRVNFEASVPHHRGFVQSIENRQNPVWCRALAGVPRVSDNNAAVRYDMPLASQGAVKQC